MLGGVLSISVAITNGVITGDWFWLTWNTFPRVAFVDIFWIFSGITALILVFFVLKTTDGTDKPQPIKKGRERVSNTIEKPLIKPKPSINQTEPQLAINKLD